MLEMWRYKSFWHYMSKRLLTPVLKDHEIRVNLRDAKEVLSTD